MNSAALKQVEAVQRYQANELRDLDRRQGRAPSLSDLRRINEMRQENELLFKNLELTLPEQRGDDDAQRYEARLLTSLARHSPKWRGVDIQAAARANALTPIGAEIRADAQRVADDGTVGSFRNPGQLRRIEKVDQSGRKVTEWAGPLWFGQQFMLPFHQAIRAFGDGKGRWYDTGGEITGRRR